MEGPLPWRGPMSHARLTKDEERLHPALHSPNEAHVPFRIVGMRLDMIVPVRPSGRAVCQLDPPEVASSSEIVETVTELCGRVLVAKAL